MLYLCFVCCILCCLLSCGLWILDLIVDFCGYILILSFVGICLIMNNYYQEVHFYYWRRRRVLAAYLLKKRLQNKKKCRSVGTCEIFKFRKQQGAFHNLVKEMIVNDSKKFRNYHRMTIEDFNTLLEKVSPLISKCNFYREPISAAEMLSATLRYLAAGVSMKSISYNYRLGLSTVSNIIKDTCSALWECLHEEYLPVPNEALWNKTAKDFELKWNFPNCIGAIDGKHIRIQAPPNSGSDYYNYKDFFSTILLAVCDADYCFTVVDIGSKGRQSDGGVFRSSNFGKLFFASNINLPSPRKLNESHSMMIPYYLVADAAFPFSNNLMRPYPGQFLPQKERIFNYRLSRARRVIENTFGILTAKWRILERPIIAKLETTDKMVKALVCLHNFLRKSDIGKADNVRYCPSNYVDRENEDGDIIPGEWRNVHGALPQAGRMGGNAYARSATNIRNFLADYFLTTAPIEAQWSK